MKYINSITNQKIKYVRSLYEKRGRDAANAFIVEGRLFVDEIPLDWDTEFFLVSETFSQEQNYSLKKYSSVTEIFILSDNIFNRITDTVNPQGILAVCKQKEYDATYMQSIIQNCVNPFFLLLEQINDPGNLGTIIRTADAAGVNGVFISKDSVDIYNHKVLRSAAGSIFHLPFIKEVDIIDIINTLKMEKISVYAASLSGKDSPYSLDLTKGCAFIIGNEARGLSLKAQMQCDNLIKIPIIGKAESLNASVACGILLYETVRQRNK